MHQGVPSSAGLALVVNTYNQPDYLARVLEAVAAQSQLPHEVLVADDGSGPQTQQVFARWAARHGEMNPQHVWQQHEGFRRARVLNQAIARSGSAYLVFLDGDTIPHPHFVADHKRLQTPGAFVQGHRALLKQRGADWFGLGPFSSDRRRAFWTGQLQGLKHAYRWPRPMVRQRSDLRGVRGCNLAIWRSDLFRVNGYNEDFVGWGREDSELAVRLMNSDVRRLDVRGRALCYHLWHPVASRASLEVNDHILDAAQRDGAKRCNRGLDQYGTGDSNRR
jgi:glycosyltransferase involved in cell wall biosynthesis